MRGTKPRTALPVHSSEGAQTAAGCVCHRCSESSEVPLAFPSSPRKAQIDCRPEVWPSLGLCPCKGNGTAPPCPGKQLCHPAVPVAALVSDWGRPPGASEGQGTSDFTTGSQTLWSLCEEGGVSQSHLPLIAEPHLPSWLKTKAPGLSLPPEVSSGVRNGHFRQTHAPSYAPGSGQTFFVHPRNPKVFIQIPAA